jgi:hypothetical protein
MLPNEFSNISLNNYVSGPCSPILEENFLGIYIKAPETILLDPDMSIPISGSYRFLAGFWNRFTCLRYEMALVVVNAETHFPIITNLRYLDYVPSTRKFNEMDEGFDEKTAAGWFNANLLFYRTDFPKVPATYNIFAIIGAEKSNVLTVRIAKP